MSSFEIGICFASFSERKTAQVAVEMEDSMSWKFGKLANTEIVFLECLIAGFRELGWEFQSRHDFSMGC